LTRRLPDTAKPAAVVGAIWLAAATAAAVFALGLVEFVVMPDELGYVKQAVELAHGHVVTPGELWFNSWALLRPLTLAPFYRLLATPQAFDAAHVAGAVLMAGTAVPAYLLARRVLAWRPAAYLVAAASVAVPWLAMAGTMMTEAVAYPAFTWALLAMTVGVARGGWRADALVAAALALAFFARTQLVILAAAYAAAVVVHAIGFRGAPEPLGRRLAGALRAHWLFAGGTAVLALAVVATGSAQRFLGGYAEPTHGTLFPPGSLSAARELLVYVAGAVAMLPLACAAAWVLTTLGRRYTRPEAHALSSVVLVTTVAMTLVGGAFTVRFTAGINDRYLFYVIPLLLVCTAALLLERPRRWRAALLGSAAVTTWLAAASEVSQEGPSLVSPSMPFHTWLHGVAGHIGLGTAGLLALVGAVLAVGVVAASRAVRAPILTVAVLGAIAAFGAAETGYTYVKVAQTQSGVAPAFLAQRGWVDRGLPPNAQAALVLASLGPDAATTATWWDTTFWNKSVRAIYMLPGGNRYDQGSVGDLVIDPRTGRMPALDPYRYVVRYANDTRFGLRGSSLVASNGGLLALEADRPYRAEWLLRGKDPNAGTIPAGTTAHLRLFAAAPASGPRTVVVTFAAAGAAKPVPVEVGSGAGRARAVVPAGGRSAVTLTAEYRTPGYADLSVAVPGGPAGLLLAGVEQR
jgi:hypothetical protein